MLGVVFLWVFVGSFCSIFVCYVFGCSLGWFLGMRLLGR
jgi:hypothetical protein